MHKRAVFQRQNQCFLLLISEFLGLSNEAVDDINLRYAKVVCGLQSLVLHSVPIHN